MRRIKQETPGHFPWRAWRRIRLRARFVLLAVTLSGYAGQLRASDLDLLQLRAEDRRLKAFRLWMNGLLQPAANTHNEHAELLLQPAAGSYPMPQDR